MDELVKRVLAVRPRLAPDDRAGRKLTGAPRFIDMFPIRFHIELLQVGRKPEKRLGIRNDCDGGKVEEIAIPDTEKS